MTINKRNEQISSVPFKGANSLLLTGKETGSHMLSVNEINLEQGSKSDYYICLLYTSPSPRDLSTSRMPSSA